MIFFRLTINKLELMPKSNEQLIEYSSDEFCIRCGTKLIKGVCNGCPEFGLVNVDTKFYRYPLMYPFDKTRYEVNNVVLTQLQKQASDYIIEKTKSSKDILIWAVCGAGKTEITFSVIAKYLNEQKYIAFIIPRRDLLMEIAIRLRKQF